MTATMKRSLLDPYSGKARETNRGSHGLEVDREIPGTYRHYRAAMEQEFGRGNVPTLGDIVSGAVGFLSCPDDSVRTEIGRTLTRTMAGFTGSGGGFALPTGMAEDIWDRARTTDGPWKRCNWWPVNEREWWFPVVGETSRANGSRWGGIQATWGLSETALPAASQSALNRMVFTQNRLLIYTPNISRDLMSDSRRMDRWLQYAGMSELRFQIENAMINGPTISGTTPTGTDVGPQGVVGGPATVVVPKQSGQGATTIVYQNIDALWSAIAAGNKENCCFHANDDTIQYIDEIATGGQWSESIYLPRGANGNKYALIKGCDLIPSECCPSLGNPGDLIAVDWSDYCLTYLQYKPTDSPLAFGVEIPNDLGHRGIVGLPEDAVESRMSAEALFTTDQLAFLWKFRGDGRFLWATTMTNVNGKTVGPAAILAPR